LISNEQIYFTACTFGLGIGPCLIWEDRYAILDLGVPLFIMMVFYEVVYIWVYTV
jgi:hypothetical protein